MFEDDEQVKRFLETVGEFSNVEIDDCETDETEGFPGNKWEDKIAGNKVLQLKGNIIPRGLVPVSYTHLTLPTKRIV